MRKRKGLEDMHMNVFNEGWADRWVGVLELSGQGEQQGSERFLFWKGEWIKRRSDSQN